MADGVAICTVAGHQERPTIISDGSGGAIITWQDGRSGNWDVYVQRVNASGAVQWAANGVALCTATGDQNDPKITSDGAAGAIVTWWDRRSGNYDIYAQRVSASGAVQRMADGVAICTATGDQWYPTIASDEVGGAIITWYGRRSGNNDIYAQRVNAYGAVQWTTDGVALCSATGKRHSPMIVSDGAGGAIITWEDCRRGNYDIYAQRVNASGAAQWTADGVALCTATGDQRFPQIISDGAGGAIVTWWDHRSSDWDVYAQRVSASGALR
jgi:predicted lipoprotein with Yx(FWY)xxD motif